LKTGWKLLPITAFKMKKNHFPEYAVLSLALLKEAPRNANTHPEAQIVQIVESIRQFGFTNPIIIDEENEIIAGHGRRLALLRMGGTEAPTIRMVGLTVEQKLALLVADNKIAEGSEWDEGMLRDILSTLKEADFDIGITGFSEDDYLEMMALNLTDDPQGPVEGEDEIPGVPVEAKSRTGDVFICGRHRVMCGDSTHQADVNKLMAGRVADLVLTDPPYNVAYVGKTKEAKTIENDSMGGEQFRSFLTAAFGTANEVLRSGGAFYIWHADLEGYNFRGACGDVGWQIRQCLVWQKNQFVLGRQDYQWQHEPCLYGWKDGASHTWSSDRKQVTLLVFDRPKSSEEHPTMKPVALFEYQMMNNTVAGDLVLDVFGGSGTTLIAAEKNNRAAHLMEIDPSYVDVIVKRWEDFTGQKAVLEDAGAKPIAKLPAEKTKITLSVKKDISKKQSKANG
jgi:DNA modification methylase